MKLGRKAVFARNTAVMTLTSMAIKFMGLYLSVVLAKNLRAEGMGLYSLVISVYMLAMGLSVSGMSVAVTRISSQELAKGDEEACRGTLRRCMYISVALSLCAAVVLSSLSGVIAKFWIRDARTVKSLCVLSAALPFVSASAMLRGWYTAKRKMLLPSISQLFEQTVRILSCLLIVPRVVGGVADLCLAVVFCDLIAEASGCTLLIIFYLFSKKEKHKVPDNIGRRIADHAVPVTTSHYLSSTLRTIESSLIPSCLVAYGLTRSEALSQVGIIQSMAIPLLFFPSALLTAAGSLLTPEVVRYRTLGDDKKVKETAEKSIKLTVFCAVPVGAVFIMNAKEISMLIYSEPKLINILAILAFLVPMMYSETICTGLLRGLGEQKALLYYSVTDGIIRLIFVVLLIPRLGVAGMLITMIFSNLFTPVMCMLRLRKITGAGGFVRTFAASLLCGGIGALAVFACKNAISEFSDMASIAACSALFCVVYLAAVILCSKLKQAAAAHRVCLRIPKAVQYISCRREPLNVQSVHRAHRSR